MKIILQSIVIVILSIALIFGLVFTMCSCEASIDTNVWNGGVCPCGGEWQFSNASRLKNGGNVYYYHCEECGRVIDTSFPQMK